MKPIINRRIVKRDTKVMLVFGLIVLGFSNNKVVNEWAHTVINRFIQFRIKRWVK